MGSGQMAGIQSLVHDDPWILPQFPGELTMPDIDGVDAAGAARQQHVGKAAGRGADIESFPAVDHDPEMVEGMGELHAPARHPGMIVPFDGKRRIRRELFARLVDPPSSAADDPGEDQRLCLGPAFRETPLDEKLLGPALCNFERTPGVAVLLLYARGPGGKIRW